MKKLIDTFQSPTGFDSMSNYMGELPDDKLLVVLAQTRDSDVLTRSNWEVALKELGGESETVKIIRIGHWACGWIEYMCVVEGCEQEKIAEDIDRGLATYPVLCDAHFSEMEDKEADEVWAKCYDEQDRIDYIRQCRSQFEFSDMTDMMKCVRGEYFGGYASELLY